MATYFFDLDGTLTDSRTGLFSAFRVALKAIGAPSLSNDDMQPFLGMPLPRVFATAKPNVTVHDIETGINAFRVSYEADGIFENVLYPNVARLIDTMHRYGHDAWIVTSKPQQHAVRVIQLLGIDDKIVGVVGAGLDESDTKTELVARALAESNARSCETIMLGDRNYDVIGALKNGVRPVGALWGYGTKAELSQAGCTTFVSSPSEFTARFVKQDWFVSATA